MAEESLPVTDDVQATDQGQTEQDLLDAVMRNSPIMDEIAPPLPKEEALEADPAETDEEDPESGSRRRRRRGSRNRRRIRRR